MVFSLCHLPFDRSKEEGKYQGQELIVLGTLNDLKSGAEPVQRAGKATFTGKHPVLVRDVTTRHKTWHTKKKWLDLRVQGDP